MNSIEVKVNELKERILNAKDEIVISGKKYYVSNDGNDSNDGLTPDTAWKTLEKVSEAELNAGDGILFKRGDIFRGAVMTKEGVTYAAYGNGEKPRLYGSEMDLADASLWELYDSEHNIWHLTVKSYDVGTLVFNSGEYHSVKLIPSYINGKFVCRNDESKLFDMKDEMVRDLDVYWHFEDELTDKESKGETFLIPDVKSMGKGDVYLRCDRGNPGEVFDSIENVAGRNMFKVGMNKNVRIDNLCLKYIGRHAVSAGGKCVEGLRITNCEIGWIGGAIQHYFGTDPNYPQGGRGTVTRFGNGVEIYGGCDDYEVSDCYIYEVYDAAVTHQVTTNGKLYEMKNVRYKNNLIEKCVYGIEYFLDMTKGDTESYMDGIEMSSNIIRLSGYGWGQQRHNTDTPALIKGWSYVNKARNYTIHDNIFDRSAYRMLHLVALEKESLPVMYNNTYVQKKGLMIGQFGENKQVEPEILTFDDNADKTITEVFGDKNATVITL